MIGWISEEHENGSTPKCFSRHRSNICQTNQLRICAGHQQGLCSMALQQQPVAWLKEQPCRGSPQHCTSCAAAIKLSSSTLLSLMAKYESLDDQPTILEKWSGWVGCISSGTWKLLGWRFDNWRYCSNIPTMTERALTQTNQVSIMQEIMTTVRYAGTISSQWAFAFHAYSILHICLYITVISYTVATMVHIHIFHHTPCFLISKPAPRCFAKTISNWLIRMLEAIQYLA